MRTFQFGTDGWRGVIADDFTFDRVAVVCEAIGEYLRDAGGTERGAAIGYDNRFASEACADIAAVMLTRLGIPVARSAGSVPTPVVSFCIPHRQLAGGIAITASHNPAAFNGVKLKPDFGGSAPSEMTHRIAGRANALLATFDAEAARAQGPDDALLSRVDFVPDYLRAIHAKVDIEAIRARRLHLFVDPLYGSSRGVLDRALREAGCTVTTIHDEWNPGFGGLHPEPIPENLRPLAEAVARTPVDGAVASDGDGDRLAAMTEHGEYVSPHDLLALLLMHLVEDRHERGAVVKTISTSTMLNQLARHYHLPLYETPIGFKYISELMRKEDVLLGGEESGGIGVRGHIPERDATLGALLLAEMMAVRGKTLGGLLAQLRELVGEHAYDRVDLRLPAPIPQTEVTALRTRLPARMHNVPIADISERDGLKLLLEDGSWLLLRASGTEPVLRIYAEAGTPQEVRSLLEEGRHLVAAGEIRRAA